MSSTVEATVPNYSLQSPFNYRQYCPVCQSEQVTYLFISQGYPICQCEECHLLFRNPLPPAEVLQQIYSEAYFLGEKSEEGKTRVSTMKRATARLYLEQLIAYTGEHSGQLLEVGCGTGEFLLEARHAGFTVTGLEISAHATTAANARLNHDAVICGTLENHTFPQHAFDVCVLSDVLEHVADPLATLQKVHALLRPGGVIFVVTPSVESWSAKLLRRNWMEFKVEHLTFFSPATLENALAKSYFSHVAIQPNYKILTPEYIYYHFARFKVPVFSRLLSFGYQCLPHSLCQRHTKIVASGIVALARTTHPPKHRIVSIIVPAYNERATFAQVMDTLLPKQLEGLEKEVIVVESNSSDGTREEALRYQDQPGIKIISEPEPRGKGHAVRTGLEYASGDFILIQDADLEYDLNDYDALLKPLTKYQSAFVLGIRHGQGWKMRKFTDNPWQAVVLNIGHMFFTALLNVLYHQRLRDPYTMFKVFRRDCLAGLTFECDRFDFDIELVAKLLRKGYRPREIPVNYTSRSFSEGKKVRPFRDPQTWVRALFKYRFVPIRATRRSDEKFHLK